MATTTDYYRRLIDGRLTEEERPDLEADMQTVSAVRGPPLRAGPRDKEVADRDTVGHRGTLIGKVEAVADRELRSRTPRPLEQHDGLQVDLPMLGKPFGFAVEHIWLVGKRKARKKRLRGGGGDAGRGQPAARLPELPIGRRRSTARRHRR